MALTPEEIKKRRAKILERKKATPQEAPNNKLLGGSATKPLSGMDRSRQLQAQAVSEGRVMPDTAGMRREDVNKLKSDFDQNLSMVGSGTIPVDKTELSGQEKLQKFKQAGFTDQTIKTGQPGMAKLARRDLQQFEEGVSSEFMEKHATDPEIVALQNRLDGMTPGTDEYTKYAGGIAQQIEDRKRNLVASDPEYQSKVEEFKESQKDKFDLYKRQEATSLGVLSEKEAAERLGLKPGEKLFFNDDTERYEIRVGDIEDSDPIKRAENKLQKQKDNALEDINDSYDPFIEKLRAEVAATGSYQARAKLADALADKEKAIGRVNESADEGFEELLIQEEKRQAAIEQGLSSRGITSDELDKLEFENWAAEQRLQDPTVKTEYLKNKWKSINAYDSKGEQEKALGEAVDAVLSGEDEPDAQFGQVYNLHGKDVNKTFKAFESRMGTAKAKQIKDSWLGSQGYDEESIAQDEYATMVSDLFNGEKGGALALSKLVKEGNSLGLPEEFITAQLEAIADSENSDVSTKILAKTYLKSMQPDAKILEVGDAVVSVTPDGVKELYRASGSVDGSMLFENATRDEQRQVTQIMRQLPTKLKDSEEEKAARQNEILADIRDNRNVQDILDELNGMIVLDDENLSFATSMRVLATGSDAVLSDISAAINRGDFLQPIITVENAKMKKYDKEAFDQAQTATMVAKAEEVIDLIEVVGNDFMGQADSRLFSLDKATRERAIEEGGIKKGDERFAAATQLGSIMARLMSEERRSFGGTAITETELEALKPMLADMKDQPASAAIKIAELANVTLQRHNLYRQKEGLPPFENADQLLNNEDKIELYKRYADEKFPQTGGVDPQKMSVLESMSDEELQKFAEQHPDLYNQMYEQVIESESKANESFKTRPERNKNPGNVKAGGLADEYALKDSQGNPKVDDQNHLIFASPEDGYKGFKADIEAKVGGRSRWMDENPTIAEFGDVYAEDPNWPFAVASMLGVDPNTRTQDLNIDDFARAILRQEGGLRLLASK